MIYYLNKLTDNVDGLEELSLVETFKLGFKNLSLDIDKKTSTYSDSVHQVDLAHFSEVLSQHNYLMEKNTPVPIPGIWTPKVSSFKDYVNNVLTGLSLVDFYKHDIESFYYWLKEIAKSSKVPMSFGYRISNTQKLIDQQYRFIKSLKTEVHVEKAPLKDLYASYSDLLNLASTFNLKIKMLKSRDTEVIAKQIKLNAELGEVVIKKLELGDLHLTTEEVDKIKQVFKDFDHYSNVVGVSLGLLNELPAVFDSQIETIATL